MKNKVLMSCKANLVTFLLERDPSSLADLTKLGGQYYAAHPFLRFRRKFNVTPLHVKVSLKFPRKNLMLKQHRNLLVTNHKIKVGHGIRGVTHSFVLTLNRHPSRKTHPPFPNVN